MHLNLGYLLLIRLFAIGGQILALSYMYFYVGIHFPVKPVILIITLLSAFTAFSWLAYRDSRIITDRVFVTQLMIDVFALSCLIYFTGGSINPFISLFILPIIFSAASLKPAYTSVITLAAVGSYTTLMFFHVPLNNVHIHQDGTQMHLWGMWFGFILTACLVAYFVSRIGHSLRERDRALAEARENALHAEQILSLGTLAAGTAHELGTPLSTVAILAKELEHEYEDQLELVKDLRLLRQQVDNCKQILIRMADNAGQVRANSGHVTAVDNYLDNLIAEWSESRPGAQIKTEWQGSLPAPDIIVDQTLTHAIVNILNNAVDHASHEVKVTGRWYKHKLELEICDDGEGLERELIDKLGESIISTKLPEEGMGLGLFLAKSTFNRFGGTLQLRNSDNGGARVVIELPLGSLTI
jgi:two-component system, sensor histidine kinase RegB